MALGAQTIIAGTKTAMRSRLPLILSWLLFAVWLLAPIALVVGSAERGKIPIDFLAYQHAAEAIAKGQSPYATVGESREIFRSFNRLESELQAAQARGEGRVFLREAAARPQQPGPYAYRRRRRSGSISSTLTARSSLA